VSKNTHTPSNATHNFLLVNKSLYNLALSICFGLFHIFMFYEGQCDNGLNMPKHDARVSINKDLLTCKMSCLMVYEHSSIDNAGTYEGCSIIIYLSKKETTYHKKIFFIFQCSPLITQYTSPTFVATTLSPWKKNILTALQTRS